MYIIFHKFMYFFVVKNYYFKYHPHIIVYDIRKVDSITLYCKPLSLYHTVCIYLYMFCFIIYLCGIVTQ